MITCVECMINKAVNKASRWRNVLFEVLQPARGRYKRSSRKEGRNGAREKDTKVIISR